MTDAATMQNEPVVLTGRYEWAGYLLGFSLGGFFDGILLHQVLQWHHLLSGVPGEVFRDIRVQILADGLFHVLMYILAFAGLWLLWRTRRQYAAHGADRRLFANAVLGFGVWHVLDSVLSHWVLGIHRIRMDVDNPLFWDLLWFFIFGILFIALGWMLRRRSQQPGAGAASTGYRLRAPTALTIAAVMGGTVAALPPPGVTSYMVLFKPGTTPAQALAALDQVDGRLMWSEPSGQLWAVDLGTGGQPAELYRHGALLVSNSLLPVGCFNWTRI